jgi:hypothetical protein
LKKLDPFRVELLVVEVVAVGNKLELFEAEKVPELVFVELMDAGNRLDRLFKPPEEMEKNPPPLLFTFVADGDLLVAATGCSPKPPPNTGVSGNPFFSNSKASNSVRSCSASNKCTYLCLPHIQHSAYTSSVLL